MRGFPGGLRPNWLEVDLDILAGNVVAMREALDRRGGRPAKMAAVVKAEGYGHGAVPVALAALEAGADLLAVAIPDEALALREVGFGVQIIVLGWTPPEMMASLVRAGITPTVFDLDDARALSRAAQEADRTTRVHVKLDTGMSRLGLPPGEEGKRAILEIAAMPGIEIEGLFTHFAVADEDPVFTRLQIRRYLDVCNRLALAGLDVPVKHLCNSAGILDYPDVAMDMVRPGLMMYGVYPSPSVGRSVPVRPFLTWKTRISQLRRLGPGDSVGYGRAFIAEEPCTVATLPVGYADGYPRGLSHGIGEVILRGVRCPVLGRVCMDQTMVRIPDGVDADPGEELILMGSEAGESMGVEEISRRLDTIAHEIFTRIGPRVPRMLFRGEDLLGRAKLLDYGGTLGFPGGVNR